MRIGDLLGFLDETEHFLRAVVSLVRRTEPRLLVDDGLQSASLPLLEHDQPKAQVGITQALGAVRLRLGRRPAPLAELRLP